VHLERARAAIDRIGGDPEAFVLPIPHQPSDIFGELVVSFTFTHIRTLWLGH
jgi:hypothetical protein